VGMMGTDYARLTTRDLDAIDVHTGTGNLTSVAAGRLAYVLGLVGPAMVVDTACSSSLVSVHLACQALRRRECDRALAGGVNLMLTPHMGVIASRARMLAPDGRCKSFDEAADGMGRGEGCGMLLLTRLSDALADGHRILALIRGSAINHDGASSGLTVPNGPMQERVIRSALRSGGVEPSQVSYVEAHGTGTPLGDPIEARALGAVFGPERAPDRPLKIGSVKSNIGHLEGAAGVAGLIKVILSMQHEQLPQSLHCERPSAHIAWDELAIEVVQERTSWPAGQRRMAGVSSFGMSGTNAHIVLEEAPRLPALGGGDTTDGSRHLLMLSAKSEAALRDAATRHRQHLVAHPSLDPADVCFTAATGRSHFPHRLAVVGDSTSELAQRLASAAAGKPGPGITRRVAGNARPRIAFLFTGQGSQYAGMGQALYDREPVYRRTIDRCDAIARPLLGTSLREIMLAPETVVNGTALDATVHAQPALFALEAALIALWKSWGIEPDLVMGHSIGEYVAAYAAGVFDLEDGLALIVRRGQLIEEISAGGTSAAALGDPRRVAELIAPLAATVSVAAINGPETTLIAGVEADVDRAIARLAAADIECRPLAITHAPHSPLIDPILDRFERYAAEVSYRRPRIPLISNLSGQRVASVDANHWRRHMREPVRFAEGIQQLEAHDCEIVLEIGPQPVLLWLARQNWQHPKTVGWLPSLAQSRPDGEQMRESAAAFYVRGVDLDATALGGGRRRPVVLPTYPFQRSRHWLPGDPPDWRQPSGQRAGLPDRRLEGRRIQSPALPPDSIVLEIRLAADAPDGLGDHRVLDQVLVPATAYLELARQAILSATAAIGTAPGRTATAADGGAMREGIAIENVSFSRAMPLAENALRDLHLVATPREADWAWRVLSADAGVEARDWILHADGVLRVDGPAAASSLDTSALRARLDASLDPEALYAGLAERGLHYGPRFQRVRALWSNEREALGTIEGMDPHTEAYVLLDGCLQVAASLLLDDPATHVPAHIERIAFTGPLTDVLWCHAQRRDAVDTETDGVTIDLRIADAAGQVVAHLTGLHVKPVAPAAGESREIERQWRYQIAWQPQALPALDPATRRIAHWLIFADRYDGFAASFADGLRAQGHTATLAVPGMDHRRKAAGTVTVDPDSVDDLRGALAACPDLTGVIHGWGLDDSLPPVAEPADRVPAYGIESCDRLLTLVHALADLETSPKLCVVTRGAAVDLDAQSPTDEARDLLTGLRAAPLVGMGRTIALEHPEWQCLRVDLDPGGDPADRVESLLAELQRGHRDAPEEEVAIRGGTRYVARVVRASDAPARGALRLEQAQRGSLEDLRLVPAKRRAPGSDEVEIRIRATGINFRDVLNALGMYPGDAGSLGNECAGEVVAVGSHVDTFAVGDAVVALVEDGFGHWTTVAEDRVAPLPAGIGFEEGATVPIAFLTAAFCLERVARIGPGDRVLVHTATGGFGQAAIQLAQAAGAEVFATASRAKWPALTQLGVAHVYDSRTLDFGDAILADTDGRGVDVVLNTLTSPGFIETNLATLAPSGRFIEVSKRDVWDAERIAASRPDVHYVQVDLAAMTRERPDLVRPMFRDLMPRFPATLRPIEHTRFPLGQIESAFR
ncbi:MAG: acyltransferase domain-containing protein, partial [Pseudomonadota bacterium]